MAVWVLSAKRGTNPTVTNTVNTPPEDKRPNPKKEKIPFTTSHKTYCELYWNPILNNIGILKYVNESGVEAIHTPHDTRHTFTSMWKDAKHDEGMRRKIQGHSGQGIGEQVYTHYEFKKLCAELNKL